MRVFTSLILLAVTSILCAMQVEESCFVVTPARTACSHASTIEKLNSGDLLCAWFGGTRERADDVCIWLARNSGDGWIDAEVIAEGYGVPCWNPVLFQMPDGELLLFYKVGPSPTNWTTKLKRSFDGGRSWSHEETMPAGITGPVRNKPVLLNSGALLCGSSIESYRANACYLDVTHDAGRSWKKIGPINIDPEKAGLIQPTLFVDKMNVVKMLCRSRGEPYAIHISQLEGERWTKPKVIDLPNPDSAIDCTVGSDGNLYLVYNHSTSKRTPLNLAVSEDGGKTFKQLIELENEAGRFSYPAIIADGDRLHITYTWNKKRIKYVSVRIR